MKILKRKTTNSVYLGESIKDGMCLICESKNVTSNKCLECGNTQIPVYGIQRKVINKNHILKLNFSLSCAQRQASNFLLNHYKNRKNAYLKAVCGSGKTEVTYETILYSLNRGEKPLIAIPRKEIVQELFQRLKSTFPSTIIKFLDGKNHDDEADLLISTVHQLINYKDEFDLIILDEADAFPYANNDYLKRLVSKSLKKDGIIIKMSATEKEYVDADTFTMNRRYHGYNLKMPIFYKMKPSKIISSNEFKEILSSNRKLIIYVSSINKAERLAEELNVNCCTSKNKNTSDIIKSFKSNKDKLLISTTILERGITIKNLDSMIYDASDRIFSHQTIIQICGRVGRSYDDPYGNIYIFYEKNSIKFNLVKDYINRMNRML
ncbi:DEAD/DEAH box helicase family protein [bacterium]|nr:DEAD/DEAH box helicase family protein [bacterium]